MAVTDERWQVNGRYGAIGVELIAGAHSIAVVNRVQDKRLTSLQQRPAKGGDAAREREVVRLQESWREAEARAALMAAAPEMYAALRSIESAVYFTRDKTAIALVERALAKAEGRDPIPAPD